MFMIGYCAGSITGGDFGARQMARHIFNPQFDTIEFDEIAREESGNPDKWVSVNELKYNLEREKYISAEMERIAIDYKDEALCWEMKFKEQWTINNAWLK